MKAEDQRQLVDFGLREIASASERLRQYREDCRGLGRMRKARFWLGVLDADPEVRELVTVERHVCSKQRGRGR